MRQIMTINVFKYCMSNKQFQFIRSFICPKEKKMNIIFLTLLLLQDEQDHSLKSKYWHKFFANNPYNYLDHQFPQW